LSQEVVRDTAPKGPVAALLLAIAGGGAMVWGFLAGIDAALGGAGSGAAPFVVIFFLGAALVLIALVVAIAGLVRRRSVGLSLTALIVSMLPIIAVIVLWIRAQAAS
jgi:hypothetical protein